MAKALKTAAIIVGVAVAGFATAGAAWAVAGGASLGAAAASIGATVIGGVTAGQIISGAALVAGLAGAAIKPSTPTVGVTDAGTQIDAKYNPRAPLPYAMGRCGVGVNSIFDDTAGAKSAYLNQVAVWSAAGPVQEIEAIFVNDLAVGFPNDGGEGQDGFWSNRMWRKNQLGEPGSPLLVSSHVQGLGGIPPEWTDDHRISGYAATYFVQQYDTAIYSGGPVTFRATGKWVLAYDPRLDSTYPGGFGSQRADDEGTWAYSQNPYVHALTWLLGRKQNGRRLGLGVYIPISSIDVAAYVQGANIADANGWTISGQVFSSDDKWEVLKAILQAGGGVPLKLGARISCFVSTPRVSLTTVTAADVIDEASITATQSRLARVNTVWPTYRQEAQNWQVAAADAPIRVDAYIEEDGGERSKEITYQLVDQANQVAQLARYDVEDAREFGPIILSCKPRMLGYRPGDCFTVDEEEFGLNGQKVVMLDRQVDPQTLIVTLTCRSETDGKHAFALGQTGVPPATPGLTGSDRLLSAPSTGAFEASDEVVAGADGSVPVVVIAGAADNAHAISIIIDYRQVFDDGEGGETYGGWASQEFPASSTRIELRGLAPGGVYQLHARYRTIGGSSDFDVHADLGVVTLGPLTATNVGSATRAQIEAASAAVQALNDAAGEGETAITLLLDAATAGGSIQGIAETLLQDAVSAAFEEDEKDLGRVSDRAKAQASVVNVTSQFQAADTAEATARQVVAAQALANASAIISEASVRDTALTAEATARQAVAAQAGANALAITNEASIRATVVGGVAMTVALVGGANGANTAFVLNQNTVQVGAQTFAQMLSGLQASDGSASSAIATLQSTSASQASSVTTLTTRANGVDTSITSLLTTDAVLGARAALTLTSGNLVTGFYVNGANRTFGILASTFVLADDTGGTLLTPFLVTGGEAHFARPILIDTTSATMAIGPNFGASSDLILWSGAPGTAVASMTRANARFFLANDGSAGIGGAVTGGSPSLITNTGPPKSLQVEASAGVGYGVSAQIFISETITVPLGGANILAVSSAIVSTVSTGTSPSVFSWSLHLVDSAGDHTVASGHGSVKPDDAIGDPVSAFATLNGQRFPVAAGSAYLSLTITGGGPSAGGYATVDVTITGSLAS